MHTKASMKINFLNKSSRIILKKNQVFYICLIIWFVLQKVHFNFEWLKIWEKIWSYKNTIQDNIQRQRVKWSDEIIQIWTFEVKRNYFVRTQRLSNRLNSFSLNCSKNLTLFFFIYKTKLMRCLSYCNSRHDTYFL